MKSRAAVLLSIVMGLLAMMMMWAYLSSRESSLLQLAAMKDVVVAQTDILQNTIIDERHVQAIQVPAKYLQPQAVSDARAVLGRVTSVPVPRGAQMLGTFLQDAGASALAFEVPRGMRAVTIAVSDVTGVGGLVKPGNYVDVFGTFEYGRPVGQQGGRMVYADERSETRMLMQNMLVVAVGQEHMGARPAPRASAQDARSLADQANIERQQRTERRDARNVTVLVDPKQAQQLVLAQQIGQLTLALRSNLDAGQVVDLGTLDPFQLLNVQIPVKPRQMPVWREIRGNSVF
ncbi:MAG: Flp pilus assembly protein CpaB [Acidobacteria bacterium]|nr:Flp pilus assembly protein CpaB [Acidobacteriota bacterium]